jgi:glycogen phosphorylase
LGDGKEHDHDPAWDATEAEQLYRILEQQVVPTFYHRDKDGIPTQWVAMMRESMARLTPRFSANRAVREYTEEYYLPAAEAYRRRAAEHGADGKSLIERMRKLALRWPSIRFGEMRVKTSATAHSIEVDVYLGQTPSSDISVQLYADDADGASPFLGEMHPTDDQKGNSTGWRVYAADAPPSRPVAAYTPRIIAQNPGTAIPLEDSHILWFR